VYSTEPWRESTKPFGTGESFVFNCLPGGTVRAYRWTGGQDSLFQLCPAGSSAYLAVGGGGAHALRLESDLASGASGLCATFGSPPLLGNGDGFQVSAVEVWALDGRP